MPTALRDNPSLLTPSWFCSRKTKHVSLEMPWMCSRFMLHAVCTVVNTGKYITGPVPPAIMGQASLPVLSYSFFRCSIASFTPSCSFLSLPSHSFTKCHRAYSVTIWSVIFVPILGRHTNMCIGGGHGTRASPYRCD